eukprot:672501_1
MVCGGCFNRSPSHHMPKLSILFRSRKTNPNGTDTKKRREISQCKTHTPRDGTLVDEEEITQTMMDFTSYDWFDFETFPFTNVKRIEVKFGRWDDRCVASIGREIALNE